MKRKKIKLSAVILAIALIAVGCGSNPPAQETGFQIDVVEKDMIPVYGNEIKDGSYSVKVDSSSNMFRITACELTIKNGGMSAVMTMGGKGYLKLFMGNGQDAAKAKQEEYLPYKETADGSHTFTVPVTALDAGISCSAFSKKKEKWYDRTLVFRSDSLPLDAYKEASITTAESLKMEAGSYTAEVTLNGGSGRTKVESPARLQVKDGEIHATIVWSSPNYDYMKVDGEIFELISKEGNSTFEIPVIAFDRSMPVIANTIAMSQPHEIEYTLTFDSTTLKKVEA